MQLGIDKTDISLTNQDQVGNKIGTFNGQINFIHAIVQAESKKTENTTNGARVGWCIINES